jgi:integrase
VRVGIARPHFLVRAELAKLNRPRRVPHWWDAGTLSDLSAWLDYRHEQGATRNDPFTCSLLSATFGQPLNRHVLRRRFHTACRILGWERLRTLTLHHGRHTFISHALAVVRSAIPHGWVRPAVTLPRYKASDAAFSGRFGW